MDFVIAWVDGSDQNWLSEKRKYSADDTQDDIDARYRDWDLLKYWFRAVERYADWVENIYFVTWGHIPSWLNVNNPKLHIVNHCDFIPSEYLPTFNSHTIELNLHRINGLSEEFVYFNDDMFLTDYVDKGYFFKEGKPCDEFILDAVYFAPSSAGSYNGNDLEIINKNFSLKKIKKHNKKGIYSLKYGIKNIIRNMFYVNYNWFPGFHYNHLPTSILKSTMTEIWDKEYKTLNETCLDKFRSKRNVNQWLIKYWQLASGNFCSRNPRLGKVFHLKSNIHSDLIESIINRRYKMICINDTAKTNNFETQKEKITETFDIVFPSKSSFEV